jgi:EAL domain-containing protein (putative c-di-GMP-specific phosphodiesterase class I)
MNVIAEGVETQLQKDFLKSNGCISYQGYLFSHPLPIAQLEEMIRASSK